MSNEFSELQAVDFALGAFIAGALSGLNDQAGPKAFREFLSRPVSRQVYRHDADSPAEFVKAYRAAQAAQSTAAGAKLNPLELPLIYYFRKPGMTSGDGREVTRRGKFMFAELEDGTLGNAYKFVVLPLTLDFKLYFLAWDKPTLDKLQLAWYAYSALNDKFPCLYQIGETDTFEIPAYLLDHKAPLFADESIPPGQDASRVYAVSTGLQIATDVIFGAGAIAPEEITINGALTNYLDYESGAPVNG